MEKPTPSDEHRLLERYVGNWIGHEKLGHFPGMEHETATGTYAFRMDLGGFFLVVDYIQTSGGKTMFTGHGVIGWDAKRKMYTLHWFDSYGTPPSNPGIAKPSTDGRLEFEHDYPTHRGRTIFARVGDSLLFKVEMSQSGKVFETAIEGSYDRREESSVRRAQR